MAEIILPGTYVTVREEGLITAGRVVTGNVGVVGTASRGPVGEVKILGSFTEAREIFGDADPWQDGKSSELTLIRALEQLYNNGGRTVYAVRTASDTKAKAAYQTRSSSGGDLVKLQARTPGTWGNKIKIKTSAATENAVVNEKLAGNADALQRSKVVEDGASNSIEVRQKSTGKPLRYEIVYDTGPDNSKKQVRVDTATGKLKFTTLAGYAPVAADTIVARYEVPKSDSRRVELTYQDQAITESYTVADASHLAEQVNAGSELVKSEKKADETGYYDKLPKNITDELFGTDLDGHDAGDDGQAATADKYKTSLEKLENEPVNIVFLAGQDNSKASMVTQLVGHLETTAEIKRERIALIGSNGSTDAGTIAGHNLNHERLIFVAPGLKVGRKVLPGAYTAAAVAGLLSSLPVQASPTNKPLNVPGLAVVLDASKLEKLVMRRVLAVEQRDGFRVVKGITTSTNSAWHQITTRRIVDYAVYGVRSACNPYIGKLNNERVRGAMKATLDAFLTRMVDDEALISYQLEVSATRAQQLAGEAIVTLTLQPTFSIDFIKVTLYLG